MFQTIRVYNLQGHPVRVLESDEQRHLRLGWGEIWEDRRELELRSFCRRMMRELRPIRTYALKGDLND